MFATCVGRAAFNHGQLLGLFLELCHHSLLAFVDQADELASPQFPVDISGKTAIYADAIEFRAEPAYLLEIESIFQLGGHDIGSDLPDREAGLPGAWARQFVYIRGLGARRQARRDRAFPFDYRFGRCVRRRRRGIRRRWRIHIASRVQKRQRRHFPRGLQGRDDRCRNVFRTVGSIIKFFAG